MANQTLVIKRKFKDVLKDGGFENLHINARKRKDINSTWVCIQYQYNHNIYQFTADIDLFDENKDAELAATILANNFIKKDSFMRLNV